MTTIPGYQLVAKLGEGTQSVVYRGFLKTAPDRPLSIKVFKTAALSERQRAHYRQKVEHLRVLRDPMLLTPEAFDVKGGVPFIVQDYFEGLPLDEWARRQPAISLDAFFTIACQLATALDKVHESGIIHGGVKPHNILVHPTTLDTRLTGFVTPLDVRDVSHFIYDPAFVSGTLAYTSPEQTGRIQHVVVFSSDLYSLGIVFYELLTRRLPFLSTDPLALIHQHLAEEAPPVHELNAEVPAVLGRLVARLTLKQPERRYQSGRGLLADLLRCRTEWEVGRSIGRFPLATQDRSRRVVFISKMVGRDDEARAVIEAYEQATRGEFRALFISGMPGIGKTRLIQELQQPIVRHRGYFTSGKFDVYQKNIPYSSIIQALRNLIRAFLTESQERIASWQRRLLDAVGQNGQVLIDVIPELEALIGPQPAVPPLPPTEARNRFHGLFDRFLGCLATAESPLSLFIDDLQCCDVASFDFLATVLANPEEHPYLLLLGAYRHTEVDSSHPLAKLIAKVQAGGRRLEEIRLRPLEPKHCHEMVSYILDAPLARTEALASFLAGLTEGNPLFVSESLSYLYNEDLLYVDDAFQWRWDLDRIRRSNMPSTVVALFSSKIGKLPQRTVDLLETSACIGNTVAPEDLSRVSDLALLEVFESLKPALGQGLIIENRGNLQFIHDRVQEAVLTAIPAERRRAIHSRVGQKLLAAVPEGADLEALDNLFAIVSHVNLGRSEVLDREQAYRLADVNFHAGEKALNALAVEAANEYFATSKGLLPPDCWEAEYERAFKTYQKAAKTELMCGRQERSDALLDELLKHARTDLDRAACLADQTTSLSSIGDFIKAIETGNRGLAFFGKAIPDDPEEADRRRNELTAQIASRSDIWQTILGMPRTADRKSQIELALYSELVPDLYLAGRVPQLYLTAAQSTAHCLSGGMDDSVIYAFCAMGLMHAEREEFELSFRYEDLVRDLSARYPNTFGSTRGLNGNAWVLTHTRGRPDAVVDVCLKSQQSGKNCGDLYTAGLSYGPLMWTLQAQGADLGAVEEYSRECQRFSERYNLAFSAGLAEAMQAGWIAPMKKGYEPVPMDERVALWEKENHVAVAGSYYLHLALSHYYFGEHEEAAETLARTKRYLAGLSESVIKRQWYVFQALNALKLHERRAGHSDDAARSDREPVLAEIAPLVAKVETWTTLGPLLRPYLAFVHAERERVTGQFERARGLYLTAIDSAHSHGYTFLEGHLNECLGEMQLTSGRGPARPFLVEAARLYRSCRAERKELSLYERHPEFFEAAAAPTAPAVEAPATAPYALPQLDAAYLMRSALAISAEIEEQALLRRIMQAVIESSGAQHGYVLVAEGDHLWVRAESHVGGGETVRTFNRRLEDATDVCTAVVRYVFRTGQRMILADASQEGEFKDNPQVRALGLRSVLCLPVVKQARLVGVLYLENRLAPAIFTPTGTQTTELLAAQAAIALENARLVEEMKRAEEALVRERENLAVTLHSIGDGVIATDTTSRVVMVNRVVEELTGWSQAEASGKPLAEVFRIVNEQTGMPTEDPVRTVLESGVVVGLANHTALLSRDGRRLAIADSAAPIRGQGGEILGVVLVFRDVTEARKAELERDATIELLRIVNTSAESRALITAVTSFFQEESGCEAVGVRLQDGSDYPYYDARGFSKEFVLAESRLSAVDSAGTVACESAGERVLECMCGHVIRGRVNPRQPCFTTGGSFWTNSTTQFLASTTEADGLARMRDRCNREGYESVALIPFRSGGERLGLLQLNDRRHGFFSPEKVASWERLAGHVAVALAKFRAEEALRESEAALKDADRRKNEFLAVLSHELRNPLAPIRTGLFMLERAAPGGDQAKRAQAIIDRQVGHLTRLVDDLLDVTRISRGKIQIQRERLELGDLVRRTIEDHRQTFVANGIQLESRLSSEAMWLSADGTRIAQVVGNLLGNAAKFTHRGGRVAVTLERDGDGAVLWVRDDGEGIEPEVLGSLFQPFTQARQTLDRTRGGLGLGLALVKALVELHGGSAEATSRGPGQGAEFTVRLPLEAAPQRTAAPMESRQFQRRRVLIIEDNVDAADSLKDVLELMGHEVAVAYDGASGIATAREFRPEILLCDIGLPEIDGFEVARRFRADPALQNVVLVALTGYALPEDRQRATEAGYAHHVAKPPSLEVLERLLAAR